MKQIFSPFQPLECFEVDGVDYLCLDYQIIQDWDDKLIEQFSWFKFKRRSGHHLPFLMRWQSCLPNLH